MGPLDSVRVIEFAGIGPSPMCAMSLADLGAKVLRLDRPTPSGLGIQKPRRFDLLLRGRKSVPVDLKTPEGRDFALGLIEEADVVIEGFRPGVMERLGLGPDVCLERNAKLVYGRMTGWGQTGCLAQTAAHDINYIAISGALDAIGRKDAPPTIPLNLVGDYASAIYLAYGIVAAITKSRETGEGQVVDASIADAAAHLMTHAFGMEAAGLTSPERGTNLLDGGFPYYDSYECKDGKYVSIGSVEEKFFNELIVKLGFTPSNFPSQKDLSRRAEMRDAFSKKFLEKTRDEWTAIFEGSDACFAPVLSASEAPSHSHYKSRGSFVEIDGILQPGPVPVFSKTVPDTPSPPEKPEEVDISATLNEWLPSGERRKDLVKLIEGETR